MTELEYVQTGDYLIPALVLDDAAKEMRYLGKYGLMRFRHLKDNDKYLYSLLTIRGQLYRHLLEIDKTATTRVENFMEEELKKSPIPENLKNTDPLEWAGRMGNLKARAEEIVTRELIFTPPTRVSYLQETNFPELEEPEELLNMPF
jgi:hypothetical protein